MRKEDAITAAGLSLPGVVFIVFLTLKLAKVISWSWVWVTSPLWIMAGIMVLISIVYVAVFAIRYKRPRRYRR